MMIIGLTGASGSGKSYVAKLFAEYGIPVINADHIVHVLYETENNCTLLLTERFGKSILNADHSIDRRALRTIVFNNRELLNLLNETVHPFVIEEIHNQIQNARKTSVKAVLIDAPQLFEANLDRECDYVIAVIADKATRIQRIAARDHVHENDAEKRLSHQYSDDFFKQNSDFCIYNSSNDNISEQIYTILHTLDLL